ncbi:MAG: hypothetical protein ACYTXY_52160, partial [Nostoc sp.]
QINQGKIITADGVTINAFLQKRASKRLRYPLDLSQDYLWTVYPRTPLSDSGIGVRVSLTSVRAPAEYSDLMKKEFQLLADNFIVQGLGSTLHHQKN